MNQEIREVAVSLADRVTNPVVSAFIVPWVVWNWRVSVYLVFGAGNVDRVSAMEGALRSGGLQAWLIPLIFGLVYLFGIDWVRSLYADWKRKRETPVLQALAQREYSLKYFREYYDSLENVTIAAKQKLLAISGDLNAAEEAVGRLSGDLSNAKRHLKAASLHCNEWLSQVPVPNQPMDSRVATKKLVGAVLALVKAQPELAEESSDGDRPDKA